MSDMNIEVSSSVLSGVYACFELLATVTLSYSITTLVSCWNVKRIYKDKRNLHLVPCKLQLISNHGLTSRNVHIVAALVFLSVSLLLATGGFSMVGVTVDNKQYVQVPYLVKRGTARNDILNIKRHISLGEAKVSGKLVLLRQHTRCIKVTVSAMTIYQYVHNETDLTAINRDPSEDIEVTCLETCSGYQSKIALRRNQTRFLPLQQTGCQWQINSEVFKGRILRSPSVTLSSECDGQIQEAWCLRNNDLYCAGIINYAEWTGLSTYVGSSTRQSVLSTRIDQNDRIGTRKLKAMVLMMASGISRSPSTLVIMSSLSVKRNRTITRIVGSRQETKINKTLFLATLLPALFIISVVFGATFIFWLNVLVVPGWRKYNRFNTAMDLLSCAAAEKFHGRGYGPIRRKYIGVAFEEEVENAGPTEEFLDDQE